MKENVMFIVHSLLNDDEGTHSLLLVGEIQ